MAYNYFPATYQPNYYGGMYNPQPQIPQIPTPAQQPQPQPQVQAPIEQPSDEYVTKREFDEFKTTLKSRYKDTKDKVRRDEDDE